MAPVIKELVIWESNYPVVCDGYVKYEAAEVHRSAIMQDFLYNEENKFKMAGICHVLSLCEPLHFVLYEVMVQLFSCFRVT